MANIRRPVTVTVAEIGDEPMLDDRAMMLLFGVDPAAIRALPTVDGAARIPREWVKRGRRRTREAQAATGSTDLLDVLQYWAERDHGAALEVIYR